MDNIFTTTTLIVLLAGLGIVVLIVIRSHKGALRELNLEMLKGLFKLSTKSDVPSSVAQLSEEDKGPDALRVLRWLQEQVREVDGSYVVTDSTNENAKIAMQIYAKVAGKIIATCFFESPDYGVGDFASGISPGTHFTRITLRSLCSTGTETIVAHRLGDFYCRGRLVVLPDSMGVSKMGGVFCEMTDKSHLAFFALNSVAGSNKNKGLVFCGTLAKQLYEYYESFV